MAKGGTRLGAGRPRKSARAHWLSGDAGERRLALVEAPADAGHAVAPSPGAPLLAPELLSASEAVYWRRWEPLARAQGLLTAETAPGFGLLCQVAAQCQTMRAAIEAEGYTYERVTVDGSGQEHREIRSHPLLTHYRGLVLRVEQEQARYGLQATGKIAPKPQVDTERDQLSRLLAVR